MDITIRQLPPVFAGEAEGAGLIRPPGAAEVAAIGKAA